MTGGRRGRTPGLLWVEDGDLIEASLRPTTEVPPTPPDNHGPSPPDGWDESGESSGAPEDNIPGSSDISGGSPPRGPGPYGPPPPAPTHRRSRSPRRRDALLAASPKEGYSCDQKRGPALDLFPRVGPAKFDIASHQVELPHDPLLVAAMMHPWPPDWLPPVVDNMELPTTTRLHISTWPHWSSMLSQLAGGAAPQLHIYTDGSWSEGLEIGGYAVAFILIVDGTSTLYYDCMSAGRAAEGAWRSPTPFMRKVRDLQRWVEALVRAPFEMKHVKAHAGHPINEFVDWAAKRAAAGDVTGGRPPTSILAAFSST